MPVLFKAEDGSIQEVLESRVLTQDYLESQVQEAELALERAKDLLQQFTETQTFGNVADAIAEVVADEPPVAEAAAPEPVEAVVTAEAPIDAQVVPQTAPIEATAPAAVSEPAPVAVELPEPTAPGEPAQIIVQ